MKQSERSSGTNRQPLPSARFDKLCIKTLRSGTQHPLPFRGLGVGVSNQCAPVDAIRRKSAQMTFIWLHIGHPLIVKQDHKSAKLCAYLERMCRCCAKQPSVPPWAKPHLFGMDEKSATQRSSNNSSFDYRVLDTGNFTIWNPSSLERLRRSTEHTHGTVAACVMCHVDACTLGSETSLLKEPSHKLSPVGSPLSKN